MCDIHQVADGANLIVNGYAFTRCEQGFRVLNLNRADRAAEIGVAECVKC